MPLVPGVIAILSATQITKFTQLCGAKIPPALRAKLDELGTDDEAAAEFGIEYATRQCEELLRAGVPGLHFYTLNKARSTVQVLKNLGLALTTQARFRRLRSRSNWFAMMPMTLNGPVSSKPSAALSSFCSESLAFL